MNPVHPIASLKAALRSRFLADAALNAALAGAIYDSPPRGSNPPYLVLGDALARENATNDAESRIVELDLVLITAERGSAIALGLAASIEAALSGLTQTLDGFRLVLLVLRETLVRHDADRGLTRATFRLRAFIDPLP